MTSRVWWVKPSGSVAIFPEIPLATSPAAVRLVDATMKLETGDRITVFMAESKKTQGLSSFEP